MSYAQSSWSDFPPSPLPRHIPSLLYPRTVPNNHDPRTEGQSGRFAAQSSLTGYEPNATVEVSSAEVTLVLQPSRRASFRSVYNSGEDVTTTPVSSEVDDRQSMGTAAHGEQRNKPLQEFIALLEKVLGQAHLTLEAQGDLSRKTQRPKKHTGDTFRKRKDTDRESRSSGSPEIASR